MTATTTFEDEVRAMLARRAADIPDRADGEQDPPLPDGLRIPVAPAPGSRRAPVLAVAAAVALLAGMAGLLVARADDRSTERTGTADAPATTATAPAPDRPAYLSSLPGGVDPTVGPVLPVGPVAATPEEAMAAVLEPAFGADVTRPMPTTLEDPDDPEVWSSFYGFTGTVDPEVWTVEQGSDADSGGVVTVRRASKGWQAVAITSQAIDLADVGRAGGRLTGRVVVDVPAPVRLVVESPGGEVLGTSEIGTHAESGGSTSEMALDDLELELGEQPVVLRVEVGDRPGEVGVDGVGVAAYAAVAVPPGADPGLVPPTTTPVEEEAVVPIEAGRGLAPGAGVLWRMPVAAAGEAPGAAALRFVQEVIGVPGAEVANDPQGGPAGTAVDVAVRVGPGRLVPVRLARDGDTWTVLLVGGGTVTVDRNGGGYGFEVPDLGVPSTSEQLVVIRSDGTWARYAGGDVPVLRPAAGWIVNVVDQDGAVVVATGNPA